MSRIIDKLKQAERGARSPQQQTEELRERIERERHAAQLANARAEEEASAKNSAAERIGAERVEERAARQARTRAKAEARALERSRARLEAERRVEARVAEAQADTGRAGEHTTERVALDAEFAAARSRRGVQRPRTRLVMALVVVAVFAIGILVGTQGTGAPEPVSVTVSVPTTIEIGGGERPLVLRLAGDAQEFGARARALEDARGKAPR